MRISLPIPSLAAVLMLALLGACTSDASAPAQPAPATAAPPTPSAPPAPASAPAAAPTPASAPAPAQTAAAPAAPSAQPQAAPLPGEPIPEGCTADVTPTGLTCLVLAEGPAEKAALHPGPTDKVRVRYAGYFTDGRRFDGTAPGGETTFALSEVMTGWVEGLQLMSPGDRCKFHIPWKLAYGEMGFGGLIPPRTDLVFDVELLEIIPGPKALAVPAFVLPPANELMTTPSGLQYKVLRAAEGSKPRAFDTVTAHYAGWLSDGTFFDGSYARGAPSAFSLTQVVKGWTEGLQLMSVGSKYLFVIPPQLGYGAKGRGGVIPPHATLVFQIELVKIGR